MNKTKTMVMAYVVLVVWCTMAAASELNGGKENPGNSQIETRQGDWHWLKQDNGVKQIPKNSGATDYAALFDKDEFAKRNLWDRKAFRKQMADFRANMKQLTEKLKAKLSKAVKSMVNVTVAHSGRQTMDLWVGNGAIMTIDSQGNFRSIIMNSNRAGKTVPVTAVDLTANMKQGTCSDTMVMPTVTVTVCASTGGCKSIKTPSASANICPGSISTGGNGLVNIIG